MFDSLYHTCFRDPYGRVDHSRVLEFQMELPEFTNSVYAERFIDWTIPPIYNEYTKYGIIIPKKKFKFEDEKCVEKVEIKILF